MRAVLHILSLRSILMLVLLCGRSAFAGDKMFSWHSHLSHNIGVQVIEWKGQAVYASQAGIVFAQDGTELTKAGGLNGAGISALHHWAQKDVFLVGYDNGNIEIVPSLAVSAVSAAGSFFIEDIKNSGHVAHKKINRFVCADGGKCFAAADFGIVEIDVDKGEIRDNFTIHPAGAALAVRDLVQMGGRWVAATEMGIFWCEADNPQWYYGAWRQTQAGKGFVSLAANRDTLWALSRDGILLKTNTLHSFDTLQSGVTMLCAEGGRLWAADRLHLRSLTDGQVIDLQGVLPRNVAMAQGALFVADTIRGLLRYENDAFVPQIKGKLPSNEVLHLAEKQGKVWAAGNGFVAWQRQNEWEYAYNSLIINPVSLVIDPDLPEKAWVAAAGQIVECQGLDQCSVIYDGQCNISAMDVSAAGELLVGCSQSASPLRLRRQDGSWITLSTPEIEKINAITHFGSTFRGIANQNRLFACTPPERFASYPIVLRNDYLTSPTTAAVLTADRTGETWVGTNKGVAAYPAVVRWDGETEQGRKVQTLSDMAGYAAYLLEYETVTAIAIDGGNRKWFGTAAAGAFLQSADGAEPLQAFNENNSPLPSNRIASIAVNSVTGEVLIATARGVMGFVADATAGGASFKEVKIYPNPVRPQSQNVTITGLAEDAAVKITDAAGQLAYSGTANGGTLVWDLRHAGGGRAETGVYFVLMLGAGGEESRVGKMLIVK